MGISSTNIQFSLPTRKFKNIYICLTDAKDTSESDTLTAVIKPEEPSSEGQDID